MNPKILIPLLYSFLIGIFFVCGSTFAQTSALVYEDAEGNLQYGTYANRGQANAVNTVPDFSNAGYKGGGVPIPFVPAVATVNAPSGDDDTTLIQNAIDSVAAMPMQENGFRGAVLIRKGDYKVGRTIKILDSGIVIRGEGNGATGGTRITMTADEKDNLFETWSFDSPKEVRGTRVSVADSFVPVGAKSLRVSSTEGYRVGDKIRIFYNTNHQWVVDMGMDNLNATDPGDTDWTASGYKFYYERVVTGISDNTITIDAPVVQAITDLYGGADIFKYTFNGQISNIGFEALRLESTYISDTDEAHGWIGIRFNDTRDSWVRQVTGKYFGFGLLSINGNSHYFTVEDCALLDPKSLTTGGRKYSFNLDDCAYVLLQRCYTRGGRHDYVSGSKTPGPNVFVDCLAENTFSDVGPHHRYSTGQLYDNVKAGQIRVQNRLNSGSGHGWAGAQTMFWNSKADSIICDAPPAAMNWAVGCVGSHDQGIWKFEPDGIFESHGTHVTPRSLYYRQLQERLDRNALRKVLIPEQESGTIWAQLGSWAGDGLLGDEVLVWASSGVITLPSDSVTLIGRVRNLQMLDSGATTTWSKRSGPGTVTFGNASQLETTATFGAVGPYVLRLTVDDGVTQLTRDVNVYYGNSAPTANAGTDQTIKLSGEVAWTPDPISLEAWYDAEDIASITASGGLVSRWNDKSGNEKHLTQSSITSRPATGEITINGQNAVQFTSDYLFNASGTNADVKSVIMVTKNNAKITGASGSAGMLSIYGTLVSAGDGLGSVTGAFENEILTVFDEDDADTFVDRQAVSTNTLSSISAGTHLYSYVRNANWFIGLDGSDNLRDLSSGTRHDLLFSNGFGIGGMLRRSSDPGNFFDGYVCEVILMSTTLSEADRKRSEGYLAHKWGLVANLPAHHPYKVAAPVGTGAIVALTGMGSDKDGSPLTINWSLLSGPAAVTFADASALDTTAHFTENGVYTLRLTVDDGHALVTDEMVVQVGDKPVVTAWPTAAVITEGQTLAMATLSGGSASVPGTFSYHNPSATPEVGDYSAAVTFTPDDSIKYLSLTGRVNISVQSVFDNWVDTHGGGALSFAGDSNGDGVADGLAWLLGVDNPSQPAASLLPVMSFQGRWIVMSFNMLNDSARGGSATIRLQYSADLGATDAWEIHSIFIPGTSSTVSGVEFDITPIQSTNLNQVQVTLPISLAENGVRCFSRLLVEKP